MGQKYARAMRRSISKQRNILQLQEMSKLNGYIKQLSLGKRIKIAFRVLLKHGVFPNIKEEL